METAMLNSHISHMIAQFGDMGVFIAMFLESSIVPIPSEVVILGAGAIGVPILSILIFGALGSTLGGIVGYLLGRYAALPVILKFGKFVLIKPHHIAKAEAFAKKYGIWSVLIGRVLPVIPFKVFSITAGITNIALIPFIMCTFVGVLPRIYLLAFFGATIMAHKKIAVGIIVCGIFLLGFLKYLKTRWDSSRVVEQG